MRFKSILHSSHDYKASGKLVDVILPFGLENRSAKKSLDKIDSLMWLFINEPNTFVN